MKYLLDTHALIWGLYDSQNLSANAKVILNTEDCFVSTASFWEIAIKKSLGKISLSQSINEIAETCKKYEIQFLHIEPEHCQKVSALPFHHRDPFDRILIAQAQTEKMSILTKDQFIPLYDVQTIW